MRFRGLALLICSIAVMFGSLFLPALAVEEPHTGADVMAAAR